LDAEIGPEAAESFTEMPSSVFPIDAPAPVEAPAPEDEGKMTASGELPWKKYLNDPKIVK
jgi:hypothetical protein